MNLRTLNFLVVLSIVSLFSLNVWAHCEIPCGIYDDAMRIKMLNEHIATIEKSMNQIMEIEKADHHNANQLVRWVMNKETHADQFQEIVSRYFLTQRIKTDAKDYEKQLGLLHQMLVFAMKCKQTTELAHVDKLKTLVNAFEASYSGK